MSFAPRKLSLAPFSRAFRLVLARRPWIRWLAIGLVAATAGVGVHAQLRSLEDARARWSDQRRVPVATADAAPGDRLRWEWRDLPAVAVPPDVASGIRDDALVRQYVGTGEIVVGADLAVGVGPAAAAVPGHVVVPISDPLVRNASVGLDVAVYSDGLTLAGSARIVQIETDVVFVEVPTAEAPLVAAASQDQRASIVFLAPR